MEGERARDVYHVSRAGMSEGIKGKKKQEVFWEREMVCTMGVYYDWVLERGVCVCVCVCRENERLDNGS
jgi:hypothetical protein